MSNEEGKSLFQRLFAAENLLCLAGLFVAIGGQLDGLKLMPIFYGVCIVAGSFALRLVRKKDWEKHWAEQERIRNAYEARIAEEKERKG